MQKAPNTCPLCSALLDCMCSAHLSLRMSLRALLLNPSVNAPTVSQSVDLGQSNNPNTTPTKDYEIVQVVVYLHGVQKGCAEERERGSTPTG